MASDTNKRTFYLPPVVKNRHTVVHSSCVRLSQNLLQRSSSKSLLVPIEAMHMLAILDRNKLYFADLQARHSHANQLGDIIILSWTPHLAEAPDINNQHIPMELTCHSTPIAAKTDLNKMQQQLTGEFYKALMLLDKQFSGQKIPVAPFEIKPISNLNN